MVRIRDLRGRKAKLVTSNLPYVHDPDIDIGNEFLDAMVKGARAAVANPFWKGLASAIDEEPTMHDPCCGMGFEAGIASSLGWTVSVYDPDAETSRLRRILKGQGILAPMEEKYQTMANITYMDPDWYGRYEPTTNTLDMSGDTRFIEFMHYGLMFGSHMTVLKVPSKVINVPLKGGYFTVTKSGCRTGYFVVPHSSQGEEWMRKISVLGLKITYYPGMGASDDLSSIEVSEMGESDAELPSSNTVKDDCVVTGWSESLAGLCSSWADSFKSAVPAAAANWLLEDFKKFAEDRCVEKTGKAYEVTIAGTSGVGFFLKTGFVAPYHVTEGKPLVINGKKIQCALKDDVNDESWYGDVVEFSVAKRGDVAIVARDGVGARGMVERSQPYGVRFKGGPVHGNSGLPLMVNGQVIGLYSTHYKTRKGYLTGPPADDWVSEVVRALKTTRQVTLAVPCGHGKTTRVPAACAREFGVVLVVEPRIAIARSVAQYTGARAFVEDDEVELGKGVNFITHGKLLAAVLSKSDWLSEVNLIMFDEAHDASGMMQALREWAITTDQRFLDMTGSPNDSEFCRRSQGKGKFPVTIKALGADETASMPSASDECIELVVVTASKAKCAVMVQCPTISWARSTIKTLEVHGLECKLVSSASLKEEGGLEVVNSWIGAAPGRVVLCTDVVNYGVTMPVDVLVVKGLVNRVDTGPNQASKAYLRPMSQQELVQWVGRVGRIKPGVAFVPDGVGTRSMQLPTSEDWVRSGYLYCLGINDKCNPAHLGLLSRYSQGHVRLALTLPVSMPSSLSLVTPEGVVIGAGAAARQAVEKSGAPLVDQAGPYRQYKVKGKLMRGGLTGLDPAMDMEWHDAVYGAVKTGLLSAGLSTLMLPLVMYVLGVLGPGRLGAAIEVRDITRLVASEPILSDEKDGTVYRLSRANRKLTLDQALEEAVKTGGFDWTKPILAKLQELLSKILREAGLTITSVGDVSVSFPFGCHKSARAVAYYLDAEGVTGEFTLCPEEKDRVFLFDAHSEKFVGPVGLTDECFEELNKVVTGWQVLPPIGGLVMGVVALLAYLGYTWARHANHRVGTVGHSVSEFLDTVPTRQTRDGIRRGPLGNYLINGFNPSDLWSRVSRPANQGRGRNIHRPNLDAVFADGEANVATVRTSSLLSSLCERAGHRMMQGLERAGLPEKIQVPVRYGPLSVRPEITVREVLGLSEPMIDDHDAEQVETGALVAGGALLAGGAIGMTPLGPFVLPGALAYVALTQSGLLAVTCLVAGWAVVDASSRVRSSIHKEGGSNQAVKGFRSMRGTVSGRPVTCSMAKMTHSSNEEALEELRSKFPGLTSIKGAVSSGTATAENGSVVIHGAVEGAINQSVVLATLKVGEKQWKVSTISSDSLGSRPTEEARVKWSGLDLLVLKRAGLDIGVAGTASTCFFLLGAPLLGGVSLFHLLVKESQLLAYWLRKSSRGLVDVSKSRVHLGYTTDNPEPKGEAPPDLLQVEGNLAPAQDVLVVAIGGESKWWAMGAECLIAYLDEDSSMGVVLVTTRKEASKARHLLMSLGLPVNLLLVNTTDPRVLRSARLALWGMGDPRCHYRVVDADWRPTSLEFSYLGGDAVAYHPTGVSVGMVCLSTTRVRGAKFAEQWLDYLRHYGNWALYGHDELFANCLPGWEVVVPSLPVREIELSSSLTPQWDGSGPSSMVVINPDSPERNEYERAMSPGPWNSSSFVNHWQHASRRLPAPGSSVRAGARGTDNAETPVKTLGFNEIGHIIIAVSRMVEDYVLQPLFVAGYRSADDKIDSSTLGAVVGMLTMAGLVRGSEGAYTRGRTMGWADRHDASSPDSINKVRGAEGTRHMRAKQGPMLEWITVAGAFLANPVGAAMAYTVGVLTGDDNRAGLTSSGALVASGNPLLVVAGVANYLASEGIAKPLSTSVAGGIAIATKPISVWEIGNRPSKVVSLEVPHLSRDLNLSSQAFEKRVQESWITWRGQSVRSVSYPSGMVNECTSTALALVKFGFIKLSNVTSTSVLGNGRGGFLQGLMRSGLRGRANAYSLPEEGFVSDPRVLSEASRRGITLTESLVDVLEHTPEPASLVINDMSYRPDDQRIDETEFEIVEKFWDDESAGWRLACESTLNGGTVCIGVHVHPCYRIQHCVDEVAIYFKEIDVVVDPVSVSLGKVWVIGRKRKKGARASGVFEETGAYGRRMDETSSTLWAKEVSGLLSIVRRKLNDERYGNSWLATLHSKWTGPELCEGGVEYWAVNGVTNNGLLHPTALSIVQQWPIGPDAYDNVLNSATLVPYHGKPSEGIRVIGRSPVSPVNMREHVTGIDRIIARRMVECDLGDFVGRYEIPSQASGAINLGMYKRYDFPPVENLSTETVSAFTFLLEEMKTVVLETRSAHGDYKVATPEEAVALMNKKSTMGYMSPHRGTQIRDLGDTAVKVAADSIASALGGGALNQTFHGSPKVEKKESTGDVLVPRLFLYKTGETRMAEQAFTHQLNWLFGGSGLFTATVHGDIYHKAGQIVGAFEKYVKPGAVGLESVKWDGHKSATLGVMARSLFVDLVKEWGAPLGVVEYLKSTCLTDVFGRAWLASGLVVEFSSGCQKSGLWDTSISNKVVNYCLSLGLASRALGVTVREAAKRVTIFIEGDDGVVIGETEDVEQIAELRDSYYNAHGFPQKGAPEVYHTPEESEFCSNGYTRLSPDLCGPVRPLPELLGKLLIPLRSGVFRTDPVSASRTLTATMSLAATYFALPEVRALYEYVRAVIPREVIPASIDPYEVFKVQWLLGDFNPISFNLQDYGASKGVQDVDNMDMGHRARERAQADQAGSLLDTYDEADAREALTREISHRAPRDWAGKTKVWYSSSLGAAEVLADLSTWKGTVDLCLVMTEHPKQLRELMLLDPMLDCEMMYGGVDSFASRCRGADGILISGSGPGERESVALAMGDEKEARLKGHRGTIKVFSIEDTQKVETGPLVLCLGVSLAALTTGIMASLVTWFRGKRSALGSSKSTLVLNWDGVSAVPLRDTPPLKASPILPEGPSKGWLQNSQFPSFELKHLKKSAESVLRSHDKVAMVSKINGKTVVDVVRPLGPKVLSRVGWSGTGPGEAQVAGSLRDRQYWSINGGSVGVSEAFKEHAYPQVSRLVQVMERTESDNFGFSFSIDDHPSLRKDKTFPHRYVQGARHEVADNPVGAVLSTTTSQNHIDLPLHIGPWAEETDSTDWVEKTPGLVWRGTITGPGAHEDNSRVHALQHIPNLLEGTGLEVDLGVTSGHHRPRLDGKGNVVVPSVRKLKLRRAVGLTIKDQGTYRYILVVEGHGLADRLLKCLATGSVVIVVAASHSKGHLYPFETLLVPRINHIRVKSDLSDLKDKLLEMEANPGQAEMIGQRGKALALKVGTIESNAKLIDQYVKGSRVKPVPASVKSIISWELEVKGHKTIVKSPSTRETLGTSLTVGTAPARWGAAERDPGCGLLQAEVTEAEAKRVLESHIGAEIRVGDLEPESELKGLALLGDELWAVMRGTCGTLGKGNHFVEVGRKMSGQHTVTVHSGSRGLSSHLRAMAGKRLTDPISLEEAEDLFKLSRKYAKFNRRCIFKNLVGRYPVGEKETVQNDIYQPDKGTGTSGKGIMIRHGLLVGEQEQLFLLGRNVGVATVSGVQGLWPHGVGAEPVETNLRAPALGENISWSIGYAQVK